MFLSATTIARNVVQLCYPVERVIRGTIGLVDEFVITVDVLSKDNSVEYIKDLAVNINSELRYEFVKVFEVRWDIKNIVGGSEFAIQTNVSFNFALGKFILYVQLDECLHEKDFEYIKRELEGADSNDVDAFSMVRLYFYEDKDVIRDDWSVPIVRLFRRGTRVSCGDAMNSRGSNKVKELDSFIYHYSRVGVDPSIMSRRVLALDKFFHPAEKLKKEDELKPYDFKARNFDCMHKEGVDVGRKEVSGKFSLFTEEHHY